MNMKRIFTPADENWRPQLGAELKAYMLEALKSTNTENLSLDWNVTDMSRYIMAKGIEAVTKRPIPEQVKLMFKRFDKDLDI